MGVGLSCPWRGFRAFSPLMLPAGQTFERLLLVGIVAHFFIQIFYMVGGTLNLVPLTGITLPFLSLGGTSVLINLTEIGMALALMQRVSD